MNKYYVVESFFFDKLKPRANVIGVENLDYKPNVEVWDLDGGYYYKKYISRKDETLGYLHDIRKQGGVTCIAEGVM